MHFESLKILWKNFSYKTQDNNQIIRSLRQQLNRHILLLPMKEEIARRLSHICGVTKKGIVDLNVCFFKILFIPD